MNPTSLPVTNPDASSIEVAKRNDEIYVLYINGYTFQAIGDRHHLTRERIRQLVVRIITKKIKQGIWNGTYKNPDHKRVKDLVYMEMQQIHEGKRLKKNLTKLKNASDKGIVPEKYSSVLRFAKDTGVDVNILSKAFPDALRKIKENMSIGYGGRKWSRYYLKCRRCGTSTTPHHSHGYCEKCFPKTDIFKEYQEGSRLRNRSHWIARQQKYLDKYYDKKYYGGHREAVLIRDNYSCVGCGISDKRCKELYGENLRILHLDKKTDHDMNNLVSACRVCCLKYIRSKRKK